MSHKFTPGPWKFVQHKGVMTGDGEASVCTEHNHGSKSYTEWIARAGHGQEFDAYSDNAYNMRLIAAAPEMLEALENLKRWAPEVFCLYGLSEAYAKATKGGKE